MGPRSAYVVGVTETHTVEIEGCLVWDERGGVQSCLPIISL